MKLRTRLMLFTAAAALSANMAFAAIDAQTLAQSYITAGYTYVEVKQGPTQTKLEAIMGDQKVEVIYDNESTEIIKKEFETADDDEINKTGIEIKLTDEDFLDDDDEDDDDEDEDDEDEDEEDEDDEDEDDEEDDDDEGDDDDDEGDEG